MTPASFYRLAWRLLLVAALFSLGVLSRPLLSRIKSDLTNRTTGTQPGTDSHQIAAQSVRTSSEYLATFCELAQVQWPHNRTLTIVAHGHSVPAAYFKTPDVRTFQAYPHLLHVALKERFPFAVMNMIVTAVGGEAAPLGAERFERDVLSLRPDIVMIDYGLNDRGVGLQAARGAWAAMIQQAQRNGIKVILLTPTPDTSANLSVPADPLLQHAAQIRSLAAEYEVALVDSLAAFSEASLAGRDLSELMSQTNHPNRDGHAIVAHKLLEWFQAPSP